MMRKRRENWRDFCLIVEHWSWLWCLMNGDRPWKTPFPFVTNSRLNQYCFILVTILAVLFIQNIPQVNCRRRPLRHHKTDSWVTRPSPSNHVNPVPRLQEIQGLKYDPRPEDLNIKQLRLTLGKHFDPTIMSIKKPRDLLINPNGTVKYPYRRSKRGRLIPVGKFPKSLRKVRYNRILLPNGTYVRTKIRPKLRRKLIQFLWSYTSCPLHQKWRDLGPRFWPRWLKEGHCSSQRSCSIPPGMMCKASEVTHKVLLRWNCKDWDTRTKCRWIHVHLPLVTECACDCSKRDGEV